MGQPQFEVITLHTTATHLSFLMYLYQLRFVLQIEPNARIELYLVCHFDKGSKFGAFILNEEGFIFVSDDTMGAADAYFLHHDCRVTIPSYCYLIISQSNQKHREAFILGIQVHLLEDSIGRVGSIFQVKQDILPSLIGKLGFIVFLAQLALGLLIRKEERIIMLASFNFVIDPILKALIVNVLHTSQAFAQANKRILSIVTAIEAKTALVLSANIALPRNTFNFCKFQFLYVYALRLEVFLRQFLLLFHNFLQFQLHLPYLDHGADLQGIHFLLPQDSPEGFVVDCRALELQAFGIDFYCIDGCPR